MIYKIYDLQQTTNKINVKTTTFIGHKNVMKNNNK